MVPTNAVKLTGFNFGGLAGMATSVTGAAVGGKAGAAIAKESKVAQNVASGNEKEAIASGIS